MRRALAVGAAVALLAGCAAAGARAPGPGQLAGRYRAAVTPRALRVVGVPAEEAKLDSGTWTLFLGSGRWSMRQAGGTLGNAFAQGALEVTGVRALLTLQRIDGVPHHEFAGAVTWRRHGPSISFAAASFGNVFEMDVLVAQPWRRTG